VFAVIRLRGTVTARREVMDTLRMLRLNRKMHCVLIQDTPSLAGMLHVVKDYVTWGEVGEATLKKLIEKRGRKAGNKRLTNDEIAIALKALRDGNGLKEPAVKQVFRLIPAKKGFRHSIKQHYPRGELGYRGEKISELLEKMI
jgi:large subunit ribosomal protein L30